LTTSLLKAVVKLPKVDAVELGDWLHVAVYKGAYIVLYTIFSPIRAAIRAWVDAWRDTAGGEE